MTNNTSVLSKSKPSVNAYAPGINRTYTAIVTKRWQARTITTREYLTYFYIVPYFPREADQNLFFGPYNGQNYITEISNKPNNGDKKQKTILAVKDANESV